MNSSMSTFQKVMFATLLILIFLNSNITAINSGGCASSPCGGIEVSDNNIKGGVNDSIDRNDVYLFTSSNPFLAPTTLLLMVLPVDKQIGYTFAGGQMGLQVAIDSPNENSWPADDIRERDLAWNRSMYFVVKAITLLSLFIWYFIFRVLAQNKRFFRPVFIFVTVILLVNSFFSLATLFVVHDMGATTLTWKTIFE